MIIRRKRASVGCGDWNETVYHIKNECRKLTEKKNAKLGTTWWDRWSTSNSEKD